MNIATRAQDLYGDARSLKSPRDLEYELFSLVTGRLRQAIRAAQPQPATEGTIRLRITPALAEALSHNRDLWTVLATDLAHPGNGLPEALRAQLLSLASFVQSESGRVLSGSSNDPEALVEVNTAVMRGLRNSGSPT